MSTVRVINVDHVRLALSIQKGRKAGLLHCAQFYALSNGATPRTCGPWFSETPRWTHPPLLMPMGPSISAALINRVRWSRGLAEVKRTWGTGYRALLQELRAPTNEPAGGAR